jgi:hypothetical protein
MSNEKRPIETELGSADLSSLRALAPVDAPREVVERVRRQAHAELEVSAQPGGMGWWTLAARAWSRVGLPAALAVTVVVYLSWAMSSASALYR